MNRKFRSSLALGIIAMLLVSMLVACGGGTSSSTPDASASGADNSGAATNDSTTLTIATNADIMTTDPQVLNSGPTSAVLWNVYSRLVKQDDEGNIYNDLITGYELKEDNLTWEFTLREDVVFHDGTPLTAADVEFSLNRVINDEAGAEYTNFSPLQEAVMIDDYTVQVITKNPYPVTLNLLAKSGGDILPKAYFEEVGAEGFVAAPIGSGPYMLKEYVKDDHVTLVPFADYYGEQNPDWEEVIFRVVPESSTRVGELIAGNVDLVNVVIPAEWERVNGNEGTAIVNGPSTRVYQLALKVDKGPTQDIRVREAIDLAINDKAIVDQILQGAGTPTLTRVPAGVTGHNADLYDKYNYDPERAKELLAEAGYADGFTLKIEAPTGRYTMDTEISQAIVAMLAEVGITVDLVLLESSAYSEVFGAHSSEDGFMTCFGLGFFDAEYAMIGYIGPNTAGESNYNNQEYIDLYYAAQVNMNEEERVAQYEETQAIIARDIPYVIICQIDNSFGVSDSISFTPRLDDVWNLTSTRKAA